MEAIKTTREVVNGDPCLVRNERKMAKTVSERGMRERERRNVKEGLCEELGRYYPQIEGQWDHLRLLCESKHGHVQCTGTFHKPSS